MKIGLLEFLTTFRIGGTERHVVNLVRGLDRSRFDLHIGCFRREGEFLQEVEGAGIPLTDYPLASLRSAGAFTQLLRLGRYLRRHRIRIVHTYGFYPNVFVAPLARMVGVPLVIASIRDNGDYLTPGQRRAQRWLCRLSDCVVANAEAVRAGLVAEGYDERRLRVIRNGIVPERFGSGRGGQRIRQELGLSAQEPVVAVLTRLVEGKGVEYFLSAAATVAVRCPETRFLIVGDGAPDVAGSISYRRRLEQRAAHLGLHGRVVFTGFRSDVPDLLAAVSLSVLPSLSEGLSNAVLESMAAGIPVVATAVGGTPELVEDGVTGLLVPPRDAAALATAITRLLHEPSLARRFGEAGRRRVAEQFSQAAMLGSTEKLYLDLLEEARHRCPGWVTRRSSSRAPFRERELSLRNDRP